MTHQPSSSVITVSLVAMPELFSLGARTSIHYTKHSIKVISLAKDGDEFMRIHQQVQPDIVLLDVGAPPFRKGLRILEDIKKEYSSIGVIMIFDTPDPNDTARVENNRKLVEDALVKFANACIQRNIQQEELIQAIITVRYEEYYFNDLVSRILFDSVRRERRIMAETGPRLTKNEEKILVMLCEDKTTEQIAAGLHLSPRTVEAKRREIKDKFEVATIAGLVAKAVRLGFYKV